MGKRVTGADVPYRPEPHLPKVTAGYINEVERQRAIESGNWYVQDQLSNWLQFREVLLNENPEGYEIEPDEFTIYARDATWILRKLS